MTDETLEMIVLTFFVSFFSFLLWLSIFKLRREYASEIYLIWYIFSFAFMLFFGLHMVAQQAHVDLPEIFGPWGKDAFKVAYGWLTNVDDELMLVAAILWLGIGPQLLTYFLSSWSGAASPPRFVWQFAGVAVWSLIKFSAALSGILAAAGLARWIAGQTFQHEDKLELSRSVAGLALSFGFAWYQLTFLKDWSQMPTGWLHKVHRLATRYRKEE